MDATSFLAGLGVGFTMAYLFAMILEDIYIHKKRKEVRE